ncbi:MAG: hypothetical protein P8Y48_16110 [Novosphingobium sp.]
MFEWFWAMRADLQHVYVVILFLVALRRGAAPERIITGACVCEALVHAAYHAVLGGGSVFWHQLNLGHLAIDSTLLAVFMAVAIRANRVYPLWIGSAQIIAVMAHVYRFSLTEIDQLAYYVMSIAPSYIQLTAVTLGLAFHMWRRKKLGSYPSWRSSLPPMPARGPKPLRGG